MQWSLFVLILFGQCSLCGSCLYEYHFVQEDKTWDEAREHCRENHTDLATLLDPTDTNRLRELAGDAGDAWIGLRKQNYVTKRWHWSLPGMEFNDSEAQWGNDEPNNLWRNENCVTVRNNKWVDFPCSRKKQFICYDERNNNKHFHLINERKSWPEAQSYCRERHTDLISGLTQLNDYASKTKIGSINDVWIGLFTDTWAWSDESDFRHWDPKLFEDEDEKTCATVSEGEWSFDECTSTKPFFCYNDAVILINESMTWEKALTHCRENHRELVSITNAKQQRWVQERAKRANSTHVWVGLRYSCTLDLWFWVTDEAVRFKNWKPTGATDECDMSGAMEKGGGHEWVKKNANEEFNFICFKR